MSTFKAKVELAKLKWARGLERVERARQELTKSEPRPLIYQKDSPYSYFQDLAMHSMSRSTLDAENRLFGHMQDVENNPEFARLNRNTRSSRTVLPLWMLEQVADLSSSASPLVSLIGKQTLPPGTDSINIPKVVTSIAQETSFINAPVRTYAGHQGVHIKLLEQSPIAFDAILLRDLIADYAGNKVGYCVFSGLGRNNQYLGLEHVPDVRRIQLDTLAQLPKEIDKAIAAAEDRPVNLIVMSGATWATIAPHKDLYNKPREDDFLLGGDKRVVAVMNNLPVVTDQNAPNGKIWVLKSNDLYLWESGLQTRVLNDKDTVLFQLFGYSAFTAERAPEGITEISGQILKL